MAGKSTYTSEIGEKIYEHLLAGLSLDAIAALPGMPCKVTILKWAVENPDFDALYDKARDGQIEGRVDKVDGLNKRMVEVAETEDDPKRASVMVHALQNVVQNELRLAACLRRRKYGDKVALEHSGAVGVTLLNDIPRPNRD
jgi:hypothetical protein